MRGQVTLFIMLGLLIVFVGGFLLYVVSNSSQQFNQEAQQLLIEELRATTTIQQAMEACLNDAFVESLTALGEQGGYLREGQSINSPFGNFGLGSASAIPLEDLSGRYNFVSVGSGADATWFSVWIKNQVLVEYTTPPAAGITFDYFNTVNSYDTYKSAFGAYPCRSPSLFNFFPGPSNNQNLPGCRESLVLSDRVHAYQYNESSKMGGSALALCEDKQPQGCSGSSCICSCDSNIQDCSLSLETSIEAYTDGYFGKCFDAIEISGYDLELIGSNIEVQINEQSVGVLATPVIDVVAKAASADDAIRIIYPTIQGNEVGVALKAFMEGIWNVIDRSAGNERTSLRFDLEEELLKLPMVSSVKQEPFTMITGEQYYLYTLTLSGPQGNIRGEPWEFRFAVEDRLPVLSGLGNLRSRFVYSSSETISALCAVDPDDLPVEIEVKKTGGPGPNPSITLNSVSATNPSVCVNAQISNLKTGDYYFSVKALDEHSNPNDASTYDYDTLELKVRCDNSGNSPECANFPGAGYCLQNGIDGVKGTCTTSCNTYFNNLENTNGENYCAPVGATCDSLDRASGLDNSCGGGSVCCREWETLGECTSNTANLGNGGVAITEDCMCLGVVALSHDANKNTYCCQGGTPSRMPKVTSSGFTSNDPICVLGDGFIYIGTVRLASNALSSFTPSNLELGFVKQVGSGPTIIGIGDVSSLDVIPASQVPSGCTSGYSAWWHKIGVNNLAFSEFPTTGPIYRLEFWDKNSNGINSMC